MDLLTFINKEVKDSHQLMIFNNLEKEIISIQERVVEKLKVIKTRQAISSNENLIKNMD